MRLFLAYFAPFAVFATNGAAQQPVLPQPPLLGDHHEKTSALSREHRFHASIEGVVLDETGAPVEGATAVVLAYSPFYWALPLGRAHTDEHGHYRVDDINGAGQTMMWLVSPDSSPLSADRVGLTLVSGQHTTMRPLRMTKSTAAIEPAPTFAGKVLAGDGTPVVGALVRLLAGGKDFDPAAYTTTSADGSFAIPARGSKPATAQVLVGRHKLEIQHQAGVERLTKVDNHWQLDLTGTRTLQFEDLVLATVSASGAEGIELAWSLAGSFVPCVDGRAPTMREEKAVTAVRAIAPGHLPRAGYTPAPLSFADDTGWALDVVDDTGAPLAGAAIDLCVDASERRFEETMLQTLHTDDRGQIRLLGPAKGSYVVYAYADGCDPARGRWSDGKLLQLHLSRRTARLHCTVEDDASTLCVRPAGTFDCVTMHYATRGEVDIAVVPGRYEITRYGAAAVTGAVAVEATAGKTTLVELDQDRRPAVTVAVPSLEAMDSWWVHGSRGALGGMVSHRAMYTTRGGPMPRRALVAELERIDPGHFRLRLPISGRWTLMVGHSGLGGRCFREVEVAFGTDYELTLPALAGKLKGHVASFPEGWGGFAIDGVAGPRLCLEPRGATTFGMLVALPEPQDFTLTVPTGEFAVHHHVYETGFLFAQKSGTWGGATLSVTADATADAGELHRGPARDAVVRLRGPGAGRPGLLTVRDRMHESWQCVLDENSTLVYASDPIPAPPAVRLVGGEATLPSMQAGDVQFVLQFDDGDSWFATRTLDPETPLELEVPAAPHESR